MTNKKSTKRALLMSALSLLMCVSMLIGSTFAWFTDSVTSGVNKIVAGNLDVELDYYDATAKEWKTVEAEDELFTGELWEPGHVETVYLRLTNAGSLALKYQLGINIASETPSISVETDKEFKLSDFIQFSVVGNVDGEKAPFADRATAIAEAQKVVDGNKKLNEGYSDSGFMLANQDPIYMAMVVYMPETVGNEANYKKGAPVPTIELGVNLMATQKDAESDSFGNDYDLNASKVVDSVDALRAAINNAVDGEIIFIKSGNYNVSGQIQMEGKNITIVGLGEVTFTKTGGVHVFYATKGTNVTFKNINIDGANYGNRDGIFVRYNSTVILENCTVLNNAGNDIVIDQCSDKEANFGKTATVKLINSSVGKVVACAFPAPGHSLAEYSSITEDSFVRFYYYGNSSVGSVEKQFNTVDNIYINDDNGISGTVFYANDDTQLAAVLDKINTDSKYWNTTAPVVVNLGANTFTGDHSLKQYPDWDGKTTHLSYANLTNYTNVKFVGTDDTVIAGNFKLNGWGAAGNTNTWDKDKTATEFVNVTFDGTNSTEDGNAIALYMTAAASSVKFEKCTFQNASHVSFGGNGNNRTGNFTFNECKFINGNNLSGYFNSLTVTNSTVTNAYKGFINEQGTGSVTVKNCVIDDAGEYFLRNNGNVKVLIEGTTIDAVTDLVIFRGGNNTVTFTGCTLPADYAVKYTDAKYADTTTFAIDGVPVVGSTDALKAAIEAGKATIYLADGEYKMPSSTTTAEVNISGTKDTVLDVTLGAYMDSAENVTITGVTIKTSTGKANGNGSDYAALYAKNVTYVDCTFVGPMRVGRDGAKFVNCTFTELGNDYVWTYGNDVTFENCTFNTDGKAILIYSDGGNEVSQVSVKNCVFNSTQGAKASAINNQNCAAIEIHNYGNGVNLAIEGNSYDSNFSGEWRIKTYENGKTQVFVNGTEYTTIAIDGKTMTIDAHKNVTVNQ